MPQKVAFFMQFHNFLDIRVVFLFSYNFYFSYNIFWSYFSKSSQTLSTSLLTQLHVFFLSCVPPRKELKRNRTKQDKTNINTPTKKKNKGPPKFHFALANYSCTWGLPGNAMFLAAINHRFHGVSQNWKTYKKWMNVLANMIYEN